MQPPPVFWGMKTNHFHRNYVEKMENTSNTSERPAPRNSERTPRSQSRSEGGSYQATADRAVNREAGVKADMGPSVSMTIVGEKNEVTQHFHF